MYSNFVTTLPSDFVPMSQWPEYDVTCTIDAALRPTSVCSPHGPRGARWGRWPLYCEEYLSDSEPDLQYSVHDGVQHSRIVIWRRLTSTLKPDNWMQWSKSVSKLYGYSEINPNQDYTKHWSRNARYKLNLWNKRFLGVAYSIERTDFAQFAAAYMNSTVYSALVTTLLDCIERQLSSDKSQFIELWVVRRISDGQIVAGNGIVLSPSCHATYYSCGFYHASVGNDPVMVGLFDHWFSHAADRGIKYMHTGGFWNQGDPESWKGYSQFKQNFTECYIQYPPVLYRVIW